MTSFLCVLTLTLTLLNLHNQCHAFQSKLLRKSRNIPSELHVVDELVQQIPAAAEGARLEAGFWLVGASGGAGIARSAFPRMYNNVKIIQSLAGVGPTLGGEKVGVSPLCGLPEDLSKADINKIVNTKLTVEQIVDKGPKENYFASKGYLTYKAYEQALVEKSGCNPLAVRAIFDTFNSNTDTVDPITAQEKLDQYKADPSCNSFKLSLLSAKLQGFSAIIFLLFLLGIADTTAFSCASRGWFPDWPGTGNLPQGLIDPGFWTIKDYWI